MSSGSPDYSKYVEAGQRGSWAVGQSGTWTVTSNQGGDWNIGQVGTWDMNAIQSGAWNVGQDGAWSVGQTGTWSMLTKEYKGKSGIKRFAAYVEVPANTTEASPTTTEITLVSGVIQGLGIVVPSGHSGLTGIRLEQTSTLLLPTESGQWVKGDNDKFYNDVEHTIAVQDTTIYEMEAVCFNTDDTYAHTFLVLVWVEAS